MQSLIWAPLNGKIPFFWIYKQKYAHKTNFIQNGYTWDQFFLNDIRVLLPFPKSEKIVKKL